MRRLVVLLCLAPTIAHASYSPPLTRVRIDRDATTHTPSLLYATDERNGALISTELDAYGAQYLFQKEWANGFGVQLGGAAAYASLDVAGRAVKVVGDGYLLGAQARFYGMLGADDIFSAGRPSAVTAFVNLRAVYYAAGGDNFDAQFHNFSAGAGFMAELAFTQYFSICPYAWFSPGLRQKTSYRLADQAALSEGVGFSLRQPLRAGVDVWIYFLGKSSDAHVALSVIASLVDTKDGGNSETAFVLSYTF
jgi:hypothetical protein